MRYCYSQGNVLSAIDGSGLTDGCPSMVSHKGRWLEIDEATRLRTYLQAQLFTLRLSQGRSTNACNRYKCDGRQAEVIDLIIVDKIARTRKINKLCLPFDHHPAQCHQLVSFYRRNLKFVCNGINFQMFSLNSTAYSYYCTSK